jgi:VIT1/CCC1 family predicted Fe2+/Mn2+ transporter
MGAGKWLSTPDRNAGRALVMAGATAVGGFAPGIPFLVLPELAAVAVCAAIAVTVGAGIGLLRRKGARGYLETAVTSPPSPPSRSW